MVGVEKLPTPNLFKVITDVQWFLSNFGDCLRQMAHQQSSDIIRLLLLID
jgi:hypothetical protein